MGWSKHFELFILWDPSFPKVILNTLLERASFLLECFPESWIYQLLNLVCNISLAYHYLYCRDIISYLLIFCLLIYFYFYSTYRVSLHCLGCSQIPELKQSSFFSCSSGCVYRCVPHSRIISLSNNALSGKHHDLVIFVSLVGTH